MREQQKGIAAVLHFIILGGKFLSAKKHAKSYSGVMHRVKLWYFTDVVMFVFDISVGDINLFRQYSGSLQTPLSLMFSTYVFVCFPVHFVIV